MNSESKFNMDARILVASIRDHKFDTNEGREDAIRIIQELAAEYNRINEQNLLLQVQLAQCEKNERNYAWLTNRLEEMSSDGDNGSMESLLMTVKEMSDSECITRMAMIEDAQ
jgi:hypothetical protein